jgi:hypothetical protein
MEQERVASRRKYSAQMKALVLDQCTAPGTSVAKLRSMQKVWAVTWCELCQSHLSETRTSIWI